MTVKIRKKLESLRIYHGGKVQYIGKFSDHRPLEMSVPKIALVEIASDKKNCIAIVPFH